MIHLSNDILFFFWLLNQWQAQENLSSLLCEFDLIEACCSPFDNLLVSFFSIVKSICQTITFLGAYHVFPLSFKVQLGSDHWAFIYLFIYRKQFQYLLHFCQFRGDRRCILPPAMRLRTRAATSSNIDSCSLYECLYDLYEFYSEDIAIRHVAHRRTPCSQSPLSRCLLC